MNAIRGGILLFAKYLNTVLNKFSSTCYQASIASINQSAVAGFLLFNCFPYLFWNHAGRLHEQPASPPQFEFASIPCRKPEIGYNSTCDTDPNREQNAVELDFTILGDRKKLKNSLDQYNYRESEVYYPDSND